VLARQPSSALSTLAPAGNRCAQASRQAVESALASTAASPPSPGSQPLMHSTTDMHCASLPQALSSSQQPCPRHVSHAGIPVGKESEHCAGGLTDPASMGAPESSEGPGGEVSSEVSGAFAAGAESAAGGEKLASARAVAAEADLWNAVSKLGSRGL